MVGMFAAVSLASLSVAKDLRFDYSVLAMRDAQSPAMQALLALQQDQPDDGLQCACLPMMPTKRPS